MSTDYTLPLKALQLYGMATAWAELQAEKPRQVHRPETWMERLLLAEQTDRGGVPMTHLGAKESPRPHFILFHSRG